MNYNKHDKLVSWSPKPMGFTNINYELHLRHKYFYKLTNNELLNRESQQMIMFICPTVLVWYEILGEISIFKRFWDYLMLVFFLSSQKGSNLSHTLYLNFLKKVSNYLSDSSHNIHYTRKKKQKHEMAKICL